MSQTIAQGHTALDLGRKPAFRDQSPRLSERPARREALGGAEGESGFMFSRFDNSLDGLTVSLA
jgi:hypothetical protein